MADQVPSRTPIDSTPPHPQPPIGLVDAAERSIPAVLANESPGHDGTIELVAAALVLKLTREKHTVAAAHWAVHHAVLSGRLRTGLVNVTFPSYVTPNRHPHGPEFIPGGGGGGPMAIPEGKPTPFESFKVVATEALWDWWRSCAETPPVSAEQFIERLLAGPDDVELTPREMARLTAHLRQPVNYSTMYNEQNGSGPSPTTDRRNKLKLVYNFNRELQKALNPTDRASNQPEHPLTVTPTGPQPQPKRSTERGDGEAKLIAALTKHHKYADGSCLMLEPIGNNELAKAADVSISTASKFFKSQFNGFTKYKALCHDVGNLSNALKLLNGEIRPHLLYGSDPDDRSE